MSTPMVVFGIILIVLALFLIIAVLMQQGKSHNLSGTIAGGAETFFGKTKGQAVNKKLSVLTSVISVLFVFVVVGFYVSQDSKYNTLGEWWGSLFSNETVQTQTDGSASDTSADSDADTSADTSADSDADTSADTSADSGADTSADSTEG